jgi:hypothetical protein
MRQRQILRGCVSVLSIISLLMAGCVKDLVRDDVKLPQTGAHCSGSEGVDDSAIAVLPVPIVAFFVPHVNFRDIKGDDYLRRCGESTKLINRQVTVNRTSCLLTGLISYIPTLGIFQWCPARVSWEADVKS